LSLLFFLLQLLPFPNCQQHYSLQPLIKCIISSWWSYSGSGLYSSCEEMIKNNPEVLSTSLHAAINDDHDANVNTLQNNPVYATSTETLQKNPAYTTCSTNKTVPVYASNNSSDLYSTVMDPNQVNNDDYI
uniref:Uncharacterized protein n=1 Tax=Amphimedon queenslandica TaxID=400682 RepID=A0A1X7SVJ3_AMPQE